MTDRPHSEWFATLGADADDVARGIGAASPSMADYIRDGAFGTILDNLGVGRRERQLMTLASLIALGAERQLEMHVRLSLDAGLEPAEILSAVEHAAVYAGFPRALSALSVVRRTLTELDAELPVGTVCRVPANGQDFAVLIAGPEDAPPLVLLHCLAMDHRMWRRMIGPLAERFRVIAPDLRGHGFLGRTDPLTDLDEAARDVTAILDALGIERAHVLGTSMGGAIAQHVALDHAGRVDRLLLVATLCKGVPAFADRAAAAERNGVGSLMDVTLTRWFRPEDLAVRDWPVRNAALMVERCTTERWASAWRALEKLETVRRLDAIAAPTLLVAGAEDTSTTPEMMKTMADAIPESEFRVIDGAPHLVCMTHGASVAAEASRFLSQ